MSVLNNVICVCGVFLKMGDKLLDYWLVLDLDVTGLLDEDLPVFEYLMGEKELAGP